MGKSSRKYRPKASLSSTTTKATTPINNGDSNNYYESFPIVSRLSHSRSRSRSRTPSTDQAPGELEGGSTNNNTKWLPSKLSPENSKAIESSKSLDDPGNPLGNAVDFCVTNIQTLHTKSINAIQTTKSIDVTSVLKSCHETTLESVLEEVFLCNNLICKPNASNLTNIKTTSTSEGTATEGEEDPMQALSQNKKGGKQRWKKKTLMIMPGKKFLRSMSLKRKKSLSTRDSTSASTSRDTIAGASPSVDLGADLVVETNNHDDDEQSLIWKGIEDEQTFLTKDATAISSESDEDTLFTNLDNGYYWNTIPVENQDEITRPAESQAKITTVDSKREHFGDEGPSEQDTTFHLLFSPVALCNLSTTLPEGTVDPDAIPIKGNLVLPRDFKTDAAIDSKQQNVIVPTKTTKQTRSPKISIVGTDSKKTAYEDSEDEAKVEFEMILDDSRFGHRKWGKIIPWKKLGYILSSSSSHTNSRSSRGNASRSSSRSWSGSQMSSTKKHTPQDSTAKSTAEQEKDLARRDHKDKEEDEDMEAEPVPDSVSISRNIIEPRSSPTPSVASSSQSAQILRKRKLQSALKGFSSSRKNGLKRTSSTISKQRRASWKKMLIVTVPSGQKLPQQQEHQEYRSPSKTNHSEISGSHEERSHSNSFTKLAKEEETSTGSDHLQHSESNEEKVPKDTIAKEAESSITCTMKDQSSTAVMGLHDWSWGVFNVDLKDDEDFDDSDLDLDIEEEDPNQLILGGVAIPFFGIDHEEDERTEFSLPSDACCHNRDHSYTYGEELLSYYDGTKHDDWIMDEDQLVSFEDDSTRKTIDSYISKNDNSTETFEDNVDEDTIVSTKINEMNTSASASNRKKFSTKSTKLSSSRNRLAKAINNHTVAQMQNGNQPSRSGFVAVQKSARSKSIFKTFSPLKRKKKNKGTINITSDISINAVSIGSDVTDAEDDACVIETVLIDPTAKSKRKSTITKPVAKTKGKNQKGSTSIAVAAAAAAAAKPTSETKRKNRKGTSSIVVAAAAAAATAAVVSKVASSTEDYRDDIDDDRSRRHNNRNINSSRSFQSNFSRSSATTKKGNHAKKLWVGKPAAEEGKLTASAASMPTEISTTKKENHAKKLWVGMPTAQERKSTVSVASMSMATSGSEKKWTNRILSKSFSRTSSKASQMSGSKDIITVVSKRSSVSEDAAAAAAVATRIRNNRTNDYLDRYTTLMDGDSTSSSSDSSSWARDDVNRYAFGSPQDVIRE